MTGLARGFACLAIAAVGCSAIAMASTDAPLRAMRWLAPGADKVGAMTTRPAECLSMPRGADAAYAVEVGRAAFRTPLLLGGQAARAGVSCETCHKGAHTIVDFDFPGVSGAPGTADVTDSLFSSHRGDGIDNPKPSPTSADPRPGSRSTRPRRAARWRPSSTGW
jgi:hypothetical protein